VQGNYFAEKACCRQMRIFTVCHWHF